MCPQPLLCHDCVQGRRIDLKNLSRGRKLGSAEAGGKCKPVPQFKPSFAVNGNTRKYVGNTGVWTNRWLLKIISNHHPDEDCGKDLEAPSHSLNPSILPAHRTYIWLI